MNQHRKHRNKTEHQDHANPGGCPEPESGADNSDLQRANELARRGADIVQKALSGDSAAFLRSNVQQGGQ